MGNNSTQYAQVNIKSSGSFEDSSGNVGSKCLYHHFDNMGNDAFTLENCSTQEKNFRYDTFVADELKKYIP